MGRPSLGPRRPIYSSMPEEIADRISRYSQLTRKPVTQIVADLVVRHADEINHDLLLRLSRSHSSAPTRHVYSRIPEKVADKIDALSQATGKPMGEIVADLVVAHADEIDPDPLEAGAIQPRLTFDTDSGTPNPGASQPELALAKERRIA